MQILMLPSSTFSCHQHQERHNFIRICIIPETVWYGLTMQELLFHMPTPCIDKNLTWIYFTSQKIKFAGPGPWCGVCVGNLYAVAGWIFENNQKTWDHRFHCIIFHVLAGIIRDKTVVQQTFASYISSAQLQCKNSL